MTIKHVAFLTVFALLASCGEGGKKPPRNPTADGSARPPDGAPPRLDGATPSGDAPGNPVIDAPPARPDGAAPPDAAAATDGARPADGAQTSDGRAGPPAAFEISGVLGPDDRTADTWLMGASTTPTIQWKASAGAQGYEVTVYEEDGTTVKCAAMQRPGDATSAVFSACTLTEGLQYRVSVVATAGAARTVASNDKLRFAVGAIVLGQPDAKTNDAIRLGLVLPNDVFVVGSRLLVADQNNSRVLIWNSIPTMNHTQADLVLGQPDFSTGVPDYGGVSARGFRGTNAVASDGTRLFVADRFNYRVLIWNTFPTKNFQPADVVLGQPDFTSSTINAGGVSARSMGDSWMWIGAGKLFVADRESHRVLIWNSFPTQNFAPADVVLGQPDMTSTAANNGGLSASSVWDPGRGWVDGTRLYLPDLANHRVQIWNTIPTSNNAPADLVLGQPNLTTNAPNAGGAISAAGLQAPIAVYASGNTVAVAEYDNNRVLLWTSPIMGSGQAANVVLGQPGFTTGTVNTGGLSGATMSSPNSIGGDGTRLIISDRFNHRVLIYPTVPTTNGANPSVVIGQPNLTSNRLNNGGPVTASSLANPMSLAQLGARLAIADSDNSRVLIWDAPPTSRTELPKIVLGQPDFSSFGQVFDMASARAFCGPWHVQSDGTHLLLGEQCNRRVSIWNTLPTATQQPIDLVVGQPDLTSSAINNGGRSASSLHLRPQPHSDGQKLFVADPQNHRVLIWNSFPTTNGKAADLVLGQPDMMSGMINNGGLGAQTLALPLFVYVSGGKLFVSDTSNNRVLIWKTIPTSNRVAADLVLGQPNMSSGAAAAASARSMTGPRGIHVDARGRLYVVDGGNHRVLYWNAIPTENQAPADGVIGQPNLDSGLANNSGLTARTLQGPFGVLSVGDLLYVADSGNNRVLVVPRP